MPVKSCLSIGLLILCFIHPRSALSDEVLNLADELMAQGNFSSAITEYKRFIFFNQGSEKLGYARYNMGLAYRQQRKWQKAIDELKASIRMSEDAIVAGKRRISLATTFIASGNYSLARLELLRVSDLSLRLKASYYYGLTSLYMFDWDAVEDNFGSFYSEYQGGEMDYRAGEVNSILQETRDSYRSVWLARFMSTILPGSGQMYAGYWVHGLNALAINGLTLGLLANSIYRKSYTDAAIMLPIAMRYYLGNRYHAGMDVRKYNKSLERQSAWRILNIIREDEP